MLSYTRTSTKTTQSAMPEAAAWCVFGGFAHKSGLLASIRQPQAANLEDST